MKVHRRKHKTNTTVLQQKLNLHTSNKLQLICFNPYNGVMFKISPNLLPVNHAKDQPAAVSFSSYLAYFVTMWNKKLSYLTGTTRARCQLESRQLLKTIFEILTLILTKYTPILRNFIHICLCYNSLRSICIPKNCVASSSLKIGQMTPYKSGSFSHNKVNTSLHMANSCT